MKERFDCRLDSSFNMVHIMNRSDSCCDSDWKDKTNDHTL